MTITSTIQKSAQQSSVWGFFFFHFLLTQCPVLQRVPAVKDLYPITVIFFKKYHLITKPKCLVEEIHFCKLIHSKREHVVAAKKERTRVIRTTKNTLKWRKNNFGSIAKRLKNTLEIIWNRLKLEISLFCLFRKHGIKLYW